MSSNEPLPLEATPETYEARNNERWITVGADKGDGQPVLIDKRDGTIKAGMGGKFNGKKIGSFQGKGGSDSQAESKPQESKPAAQSKVAPVAKAKPIPVKEHPQQPGNSIGGLKTATPRPQPKAVQSFAESIMANIRAYEAKKASGQTDGPQTPDPKSHEHHHSKLPPNHENALLNWAADAHRLTSMIGVAAHGAKLANQDPRSSKSDAFSQIDQATISKLLGGLKSLVAAAKADGIDLAPFVRHNKIIPRTLAAKMKPSRYFDPVEDHEKYAASQSDTLSLADHYMAQNANTVRDQILSAFAQYSAPAQPELTIAEHFAAAWKGITVEQYAARKAKNSPGQLGLFGDGVTGKDALRTTARQGRFDWDESKHPRANDGKFAEVQGAGSVSAGGEKDGAETDAEKRKRLREYWAKLAKEQEGKKAEPTDEPAKEPASVAPEPEPEPKSEPAKPPASEPDIHSPGSPVNDLADDPKATPREQAEARQRQLDADYEHARASAIPNAGEDLKGSARHKVNAWKSLEQAESDGTAAELVTRDQLLKNEPHELGVHVESNPITSLLMHEALRAFPPKPGYGQRSARGKDQQDRSDYLDAYRAIKSAAEKIAASGEDNPVAAAASLKTAIKNEIDRLRKKDHFSNTANSLINLYNNLANPRKSNSTLVKTAKFIAEIKVKADAESQPIRNAIVDAAHEVMGGKTMNAVLGVKGDSKSKKFSAADLYVAIADRKGGPEIPAKTAKESLDYLVNDIGLRGVQFGNTVSDAEREHHAKMAAGAMVDLASVLGIPVKDVSLDGKLGLAMGARGNGNALAHYEPDSKVINLTRKKGVGSLAHEWAHAFDHHMGGGGIKKHGAKSSAEFHSASRKEQHVGEWVDGKFVRSMVDNKEKPVFKEMFALHDSMDSSGYQDRLNKFIRENRDFIPNPEYWKSREEIFARCFERHIQYKLEKDGRKNTYLAGIETKAHKSGGFWPTNAEVEAMAPAFDKLIDAYRTERLGVAERVKYSANDRARIAEAIADAMIERYRVGPPAPSKSPSPGSKPAKPKSEKSQVTTGSFGDKGKFITLEDGRVVFLESKESLAKKRKRRDDAKAPFVPKTEVDRAIVDYVGNKKHLVEAFKPYVEDAHKFISQERAETTHAMRELLANFGHTGKKASAFISNLRHKRDHSQITGFDEMAEYAAKYHPNLLSVERGESGTTGDIEQALFNRLREGFPGPPAKHSEEVIELAGQMAGSSSYFDDSDDDYLNDPLQQIDDVPFSAAPVATTERYASSFAAAFTRNYAAISGLAS